MTNAHETNAHDTKLEETNPDRDHDQQHDQGLSERDRPEHDPRLGEPHGDEGMPASLLDTDRNLPGDQPVDSRGPNKSELEGNS
ncbi:MAG: hypothetical protein ACE37B_06435 [Ilumatobacter sp.]|uniref:hypothetical protein n=1 Tax=Ilumatobacter sp. TaxID=1967498 RepID=UPI00391CB55C